MESPSRTPVKRERVVKTSSKAVKGHVKSCVKNVDKLSTEIWTMIFDELIQITRSISVYRHVSRRLDAIVQPFMFRTAKFSKTFLSVNDQSTTVPVRIPSLVKAYTRRLVFREGNLDWDKTAEFINECRSVLDIEWNHGLSEHPVAFPPEIRKVLEVDKPHLRLHLKAVWNQRSCWLVHGQASPDLSFVPRKNLISFSSHCQHWTGDKRLLQELLVDSKFLENLAMAVTLYVNGGRIPPIRNLIIGGYWPYLEDNFEKLWDFSQLESLTLQGGGSYGFIRTVPGKLVNAITGPSLDGNSLTEMRLTLPNLVELQVDLKFPPLEVEPSVNRRRSSTKGWDIRERELGVISSFTKLRKLTIRPQKLPLARGQKYRNSHGEKVVEALTFHKKGSPFSQIAIQWFGREDDPALVMEYEYVLTMYSRDVNGKMTPETILGMRKHIS